jgi:hypothetical protein
LSARELGDRLAWFARGIVWIAQGPGHRAFRCVEGRLSLAHAFSLLVEDRRFLNGESEWLNDRFDYFVEVQIEQAGEEAFAFDFGVER